MLAATAAPRIDPKKRNVLDHRKRQFAQAQWAEQDYAHRMNFYTIPPTGDVSLEQFEEWGIARLKVLAELEACQFRNRTPEETSEYMRPILEKHMRLSSNRSRSSEIGIERKRDHYSHWTLRLAFSATADLRQRFARLETQLFKLRMLQDDMVERKAFIDSLPMSWETVNDEDKNTWLDELKAATNVSKSDEENWFSVDWEKVPELVERRQVLLKKGRAYVHVREQTSMVVSEFARTLESGLELAARFLPRMDEDERLKPILHHLSQSFVAPDAGYNENSGIGDMANINAGSIDALSEYFPLCMKNLHRELRANSHLKHFGRLQYTLFLKGIGLSLQECIVFWRKAFKLITDGMRQGLSTVARMGADLSGQTNSNPNTCTTSATPTATSAVTRTAVVEATHPIRVRSCSLKHCPEMDNSTAVPTGHTRLTISSHYFKP
jgi:DNA primase large subunit